MGQGLATFCCRRGVPQPGAVWPPFCCRRGVPQPGAVWPPFCCRRGATTRRGLATVLLPAQCATTQRGLALLVCMLMQRDRCSESYRMGAADARADQALRGLMQSWRSLAGSSTRIMHRSNGRRWEKRNHAPLHLAAETCNRRDSNLCKFHNEL